jgi:stress-induced morphogen
MKIKGFISLNLVGCEQSEEIEIDDADVEGMTEQKREDYIYEQLRDVLYQYVDMWYETLA